MLKSHRIQHLAAAAAQQFLVSPQLVSLHAVFEEREENVVMKPIQHCMAKHFL
jgi:hypothetical protein